MAIEFTESERAGLLRFALRAFPHHLGASALVALLQQRPIDDALLAEAAGDQVESWRGVVPRNAAEVPGMQGAGWQAVVHDPELVAGLVVGRPLPITTSTVQSLRTLASAEDAELLLEREAEALAIDQLHHMAARVHQVVTSAPEQRTLEPWDPCALEILLWPNKTYRAYYEERPLRGPLRGPLRDICAWLQVAVERSAHERWGPGDVDAALRMLTCELRLESSHSHAPRVPGIEATAVRLLARATQEFVLRWIEHGRDLGTEIRGAALDRARQLSENPHAGAAQYLRAWVGHLPLDTHWDSERTIAHREELAWMREADTRDIVDACFQLIDKRYSYAQVRGMVEPQHRDELERALIAGLSAAVQGRADWLAELGTKAAIDALLQGLARDEPEAEICERALATLGSAVTGLLEASLRSDPRLVLRATRTLAALAAPDARSRFEELVLTRGGPIRWAAIDGLQRLGASSSSCEVLRRAFEHATPHEQQRILGVILDCAVTRDDLAWTQEVPVRPELEGPLADCTAWLVAASVAESRSVPPELLKRLVALLHNDPYRSWRWGRNIDRWAILQALRSSPFAYDPVTWKIEELVRMPAASAGGRGGAEVMGARSVPAPEPEPPTRPRLTAAACFSVLAPECVAPGEVFLIEVFVHSKAERDRLAAWSSQAHAHRFTVGPRSVAVGATLDVAVVIEGLWLRQSTGQVMWDGELGALLFTCKMPRDAMEPSYAGRAVFSVEGLPIAEVQFVLTLSPFTGAKRDVGVREKILRSAFASYATVERDQVLARIQGMQKAVPFLDIFLDAVSLRSGDDWASVIRDEIKARDVLLLFWSRAASESKYVETEWRTALAENGIDRISPVPLEAPTVAPPPPELCSLHFHDWTLAVR